jgi:hypothetical protein
MSMSWAELHCETEEPKDVWLKDVYRHNIWINDNVDYEVLVEVIQYIDGGETFEVIDETLLVYDDDGNLMDSFIVTLPSKYVDDALQKAEEWLREQ